MMSDFIPADQLARERIANHIDETLFVEAGAGTGKTTAMVRRIISLVKAGHDISKIAAITFSEAAASELRNKVRSELEKEAAGTGNPLFLAAVRSIDSAPIQTLHSFAGSLLREKPLEAGLPPGFEVVVEIESEINFEERWEKWLDEAMNSILISPSLIKSVRLGLSLDKLKNVARAFHGNYDLLPGEFPCTQEDSLDYTEIFVEEVSEIEKLLSYSHNGEADPLFKHCQRLKEAARRMRLSGKRNEADLITLSRIGKISFAGGKQGDWGVIPGTNINACKDIKETLKSLAEVVSSGLELDRRAAMMPLLESLRLFVNNYVSERKRQGKAEFQDLLVWARDLLKTNRNIRSYFQQKFSHILIDEFQDTDPIQAEIAFYLAEDGTQEVYEPDWRKVHLVPGKLFVVGDPKQSIYRFRRADITTVEDVKALIIGKDEHNQVVPLTQNFRSQKTIINWVNEIFKCCMKVNEDGTQACYLPLDARWEPPQVIPPLGVHRMGEAIEGRMAQIRQLESEDIARTIRCMREHPWQIRDEASGNLRAVKYQDICILMPTRTALSTLERALDAAQVPYRIESQSMILGTQDVKELISCLRAIDAPADQIALVAALRSSAFAVSDVELLEFIEDGGKLDYTDPGSAKGPVRAALDVLAKYHEHHIWLSPAQIMENLVRERSMEEVCFGRTRPRERLHRLQFVLEKARSFSEVKESSLRGFLDWIERLAAENARMVEVPVPESDEDAVRIMTIHAAKGREFPVTILMGLGSSPASQSEPVIFDLKNKGLEVCIGSSTGSRFITDGYDAACECEKTADKAENIRLMYVAATRAKDHLVVSLYRPKKENDNTFANQIEEICSGTSELWSPIEPSNLKTEPHSVEPTNLENLNNDTELDRSRWIENRQRVLAFASKPASLAVTTITRVNKVESAEEYPHKLGRGGTNLGRAVHSVLQTIDLATGKGVLETAKAQAENEGIPEQVGDVVRLVGNGLASSVIKRAVVSNHYYREVFVSFPYNGTSIEGFVDLLFEEDGRLVIADYKTDAIDEDPSDNKREQYSLQAGIYALAVSKITGKSVKEVVLLFLSKPLELSFKDISSLMVKAEVAAKKALYEQ